MAWLAIISNVAGSVAWRALNQRKLGNYGVSAWHSSLLVSGIAAYLRNLESGVKMGN